MSKVKELFTEVFRPQSMDMLIAPERIKKQLQHGLVQNYLLEGPPGTGKTSTAYILAGGKNNVNCVYVNAAVDGRIEIIDELKSFCSTMSLIPMDKTDGKKVIIFDEVDGASKAFFDAMKSFIEQFHKTTRFIMTCNTISKVPEAIQSRMDVISFKPINNDEEAYMMTAYKQRVGYILQKLNITYTDETLNTFVKSNFPDMRSTMVALQKLHLSGCIDLNDEVIQTTYNYKEMYELCMGSVSDPAACYKLVQSEYGNSVHECMQALGDEFVKYIISNYPNKIDKIPMVIITVADYQHKLSSVIDVTVALQALIFSLQNILK